MWATRARGDRRRDGNPMEISWIAKTAACVVCVLFAAGAATDLRNRTVPNVIPLAQLALFAVHVAADPKGLGASPIVHLVVGAAVLAAGFALWCTGKFGAGDAKLAAAAGLWVGPAGLANFLFGLGACAFALAAIALLPLERARRMRSDLPFAVAIAPPALAVLIPRALAHDIHALS